MRARRPLKFQGLTRAGAPTRLVMASQADAEANTTGSALNANERAGPKDTKTLWAKVSAATTARRKSSVIGQNFMLNVRDLLKLNAAGKFSQLPPLEASLAVLLGANKRSGRAKLELQSVKIDGKSVHSCFKGASAGARPCSCAQQPRFATSATFEPALVPSHACVTQRTFQSVAHRVIRCSVTVLSTCLAPAS